MYGYGETDFPQNPETFTIQDEVALVGLLLDRVGDTVHLVGHSYGGAVALAAALQHPDRIRSLTLHEPVVFHLARLAGLPDVTAGIGRMAAELTEKVQAGLPAAAAQVFIDYWRGGGRNLGKVAPEGAERGGTSYLKGASGIAGYLRYILRLRGIRCTTTTYLHDRWDHWALSRSAGHQTTRTGSW